MEPSRRKLLLNVSSAFATLTFLAISYCYIVDPRALPAAVLNIMAWIIIGSSLVIGRYRPPETEALQSRALLSGHDLERAKALDRWFILCVVCMMIGVFGVLFIPDFYQGLSSHYRPLMLICFMLAVLSGLAIQVMAALHRRLLSRALAQSPPA